MKFNLKETVANWIGGVGKEEGDTIARVDYVQLHKQKLKERGYGENEFIDFALDSFIRKDLAGVPFYALIPYAFGRISQLDFYLTYSRLDDEQELNDTLVEMYYLLSVSLACIPKQYRMNTFDVNESTLVPNVHMVNSSCWELRDADKVKAASLWMNIATQVRLFYKKVELISLETCKLDYELYLLDYIGSTFVQK